jgi:nucleoside-diphosphate-sugar epimerase
LPRTLVTGGGGFIGVRLAQRLLDVGHEVIAADRAFAYDPPLRAERVTLDVTDRAALFALLRDSRLDGIVHLAAVLSGVSERDPALAFDVNVLGTFNVLEGARLAGVKKIVATSSIAAVEQPDPVPPVAEEVELAPLGVYGMSKASLEAWCGFYRRRFGLDTRVGRPGAVVGPGRAASSAASNFTTAIISEPLAGREYRCPVAEDDAAPIVYHSDLVDGLFRLYMAEKAGPTYNLGACSASAAQLAEAVRKHVPGAKITFEPNEVERFVVGRWKHIVQDNARAVRDLGYRPSYDTPEKIVAQFVRETSPVGTTR